MKRLKEIKNRLASLCVKIEHARHSHEQNSEVRQEYSQLKTDIKTQCHAIEKSVKKGQATHDEENTIYPALRETLTSLKAKSGSKINDELISSVHDADDTILHYLPEDSERFCPDAFK